MILVLLVVPVFLLYRFSVQGTIATSPDTIAVLLVFTLVFSLALSAFTKAKRHEIVAASAGLVALVLTRLSESIQNPMVPRLTF